MAQKAKDRKQDDEAKRRLEAAAACVGALLALGTIGIIVWDGITHADRPALITLRAEAVHAHESGYVVEIVALNSGDETAAGLLVEGSLRQGSEIIETSEMTLDYVARWSQRRGALYFSEDPRSYQLDLRAKGYAEP